MACMYAVGMVGRRSGGVLVWRPGGVGCSWWWRWVGVRVRAMACGGVGYPLGSVASVWSGRADQTKHLNVI